MKWRYLTGLLAACAVLTAAESAEAQEIQVTGPLAGAPAVRKLRQHRKGRIELAPAVSFTLLDEYKRTIFFGARLNYNITDWLAIGVWGGFGAIKLDTGLSEKIQDSYDRRFSRTNPDVDQVTGQPSDSLNASRRLTATNVGKKFTKQLGTLDWILAPQLTVVPFRGKISLFQKIFVDTDAYFFAGPAFIGMTERAPCGALGQIDCSKREGAEGNAPAGDVLTKPTESRVGIAPTFGLGLSFYTGRFTSFGLEYRALPLVQGRNTGGFDSRGGGADERFPDNKVDGKDRDFKFNQLVTVSFGIYLPTGLKSSE